MGSRGRSELVRRQLAEAGLDPARVAAAPCPHRPCHRGKNGAGDRAVHSGRRSSRSRAHRPLTEGFTPEIRAALGTVPSGANACRPGNHRFPPRLHRPARSASKMLHSARMAVRSGSVGGGIMEYRARQLAAKMLAGYGSSATQLAVVYHGTGSRRGRRHCSLRRLDGTCCLQRMEPEANSEK